MYPPIFTTCASDSGVQAVLGTGPVRLYPFGEAPPQVLSTTYAVWQLIGGNPENYINETPDIDLFSIQVDVYAATVSAARAAAQALNNAIETVAHITRWGGESRDPDTNRYRVTFDVDWWVQR